LYLQNAVNHFKTITKHRHLVMLHCFKAGIPLQGLMHDLSKYSPTEFIIGVKYYEGNRSPNVGERIEKGYSSAWLHHKGRNKHHYEYWFDNSRDSDTLVPVNMPTKYIIEMFCDRVAACKVYRKDEYNDRSSIDYYNLHDYRVEMGPKTKELLELLINMLAEKGEKETFRYIRHMDKRD